MTTFTPEVAAAIESAAERGAAKALASVGLHDENAIKDVIELRGLLESWRAVKHGAMSALGKAITVLLLAGLLAFIGVKTKVLG
jgi:hypothetical protein